MCSACSSLFSRGEGGGGGGGIESYDHKVRLHCDVQRFSQVHNIAMLSRN